MTHAEERALAWAREILADAMEYPRAGDGWPHYSADEAQADVIIRAAGLAWMLPDEIWRENPMDAAVHHFRAIEMLAGVNAERAARDAERAARDAARKTSDLLRAGDRVARDAARYPMRVTGRIVYLGSGYYGLRCNRSVRSSREIVLHGLGAGDKGRTVTVRVEQFSECIEE